MAKTTSAPPSANGHATDTAAKSEFLKLFWTLAESDVATRTRAATQLLAFLRDNHAEVQYTLKRLVRGLASSRDAARQGFSAALAALLVEFPAQTPLDETLALLTDSMQVSASMKAMEQREHMFGKLFGLLALHRSGRLASDDAATVAVVLALVDMSKWKKWLREACVEAMLTVLSDVSKELFLAQLAAPLGELLDGDVASFNADQVALAVGLHHFLHSHKITSEQLPPKYPAVHFVQRKQIRSLVEPLRHSTACFPRVHGAWVGLFGHLLHVGNGSVDGELFQEAWTVLVENTLLDGPTTTHERKALALKLFELVVPHLPGPLVRAVLTPHFVKCLYNNSQSKKTYLHDAARHTLHVFATSAPAEFVHFMERTFVAPLPALVEGSNSEDDDAEELKAAVQSGGFDAIIAIEEERERKLALLRKYATVRLWALELLSGEMIHTSETDTNESRALRDRVLQFLSRYAFFTPTGKPTPSKKTKKKTHAATASFEAPAPALSGQVRRAVVQKLFSAATTKLSSEEDAPLATVFAFVLQLLETSGTHHELLAPLDEAQRELLACVQRHVASLRGKHKDSAREATDDAFLVLFMSCALQLVDAAQREDAQGVVADLEKCFVDMQSQRDASKASKKTSKKKKKSAEADDDEAPRVDAVVVLTDLLLSLLSHDSSAMREIVTHVFRDLVPLLNAQSLETLVAAVAPATVSEDDESGGKRHGEDDEEEEEEEGDEGMEEEEEEEEDEVVLSSASDIADALRSDANLAELHREDQTLSAIVGQVKDKARAKKDAKKHRLQVLHFKLRVVDLLALYASSVNKGSSTPSLTVRLVLPLFESLAAIASSDVEQRVLKERLQAVLLHKFVRKDTAAMQISPVDRPECVRALEKIVDLLAKKPLDKELATKVGSAVVVYLMRAAAGTTAEGETVDAETVQQLENIVETATREVFTKKHAKFPRIVFDELATKLPKLAVRVLLPSLAQIASASASEKEDNELAAVDEFSKAEVFRLVALLIKAKHVTEASERRVLDTHRHTLLTALIALLQPKTTKESGEDDTKKKDEIKAKRLKVFLSCALQLVRTWRELNVGKESELAQLVGVVQALETSSPVVKNMVKQLAQAAGGIVGEDAETDATEEEPVVEDETPTKKQKKTTPVKQTKKKTTPVKKKSPTPTKRKRSSSMANDNE